MQWTVHPCFMGDVWDIHDLQLMYGMYVTNGRCMEHSRFMSDIQDDRIPSTTPGAEPPRDARDSGSARSHSTHLETSSSDRP